MRVTVAKMRDEGAPMHVIARHVGVSLGALASYCHKNGISTRPVARLKRAVQATAWKDARSSKKELKPVL